MDAWVERALKAAERSEGLAEREKEAKRLLKTCQLGDSEDMRCTLNALRQLFHVEE